MAACALTLLVIACSDEAPTPPPVAQPTQQPAAAPVSQPAPQKAAAAPQAAPDPDVDLAARVKKALERATGEIGQGIDVTARRGTVSLFGTVASDAERRSAGGVAASVSGVTSVDNKLVVVKGS